MAFCISDILEFHDTSLSDSKYRYLCSGSLHFTSITIIIEMLTFTFLQQSLDEFLVSRAGRTWGLQFFPHPGFYEYKDAGEVYLPCETSLILSVGYIMICVLVIPMGMINLDSNVAFVQRFDFPFVCFNSYSHSSFHLVFLSGLWLFL